MFVAFIAYTIITIRLNNISGDAVMRGCNAPVFNDCIDVLLLGSRKNLG
jgi:hypothetical protein